MRMLIFKFTSESMLVHTKTEEVEFEIWKTRFSDFEISQMRKSIMTFEKWRVDFDDSKMRKLILMLAKWVAAGNFKINNMKEWILIFAKIRSILKCEKWGNRFLCARNERGLFKFEDRQSVLKWEKWGSRC